MTRVRRIRNLAALAAVCFFACARDGGTIVSFVAAHRASDAARAEVTTVALIAVAIGAAVLAYILTPKGQPQTGRQGIDDVLTAFADRNEPIPYVIGRRLVGNTVVSVWGRFSRKEKIPGSGGGGGGSIGGGGGGEQKQKIYYESAVHVLSLGPASKLRAIYEDGEVLWEGDGVPDANGKLTVDLGRRVGQFTIWFGRDTAGKQFHRTQGTGEPLYTSKSRFLVVCQWKDKRLGTQPQWKQLTYDLECFCPDNAISGSSYIVTPNNTGVDADIDKGVNGAHIVYQLTTAPFPHGAGIDPDFIDEVTLTKLGYLCELEGLGFNLLIEGDSVGDVLNELMNMIGFVMTEIAGRLVFMPVREAGIAGVTDDLSDVPEVTDSDLEPPEDELSLRQGTQRPTRIIFTFPDVRQKFKNNSPVSMDSDAMAGEFNRIKSLTLSSSTVTSHFVALNIANRKMNETFGDTQTFRVNALRGAHLIPPGRQVSVAGVGVARVVASRLDVQNMRTQLDVVIDSYGVPQYEDDAGPTGGGGGTKGVECDLYVRWYEVPGEEVDDLRLSVFRIRAHRQIIGANVLVRVDGGDVVDLGSQDEPAAGGPIAGAIDVTAPDEIPIGPVVEAYNLDIEEYAEDALDDALWRGGNRLVAINDEVFYGPREFVLQAESAVLRSTAYSVGDSVIPPSGEETGLRYECVQAGTTSSDAVSFWPFEADADPIDDGTVQWQARPYRYRMDGLIRAQAGTEKQTHPTGSIAAIIGRTELVAFNDSRFMAGAEVCVKTQPQTDREEIDPSLCDFVCRTFGGMAQGEFLFHIDSMLGEDEVYCLEHSPGLYDAWLADPRI